MAAGEVGDVEIIELRRAIDWWREAEHALSDAYVRLREILGAFDTPYAPTREQVWEHTEEKAKALVATLEQLTKERDAAFAGGEELSAALRMVNAEVARLRAITGSDCPQCGKTLKGEHVAEPGVLHDGVWRIYAWRGAGGCRVTRNYLIANHPEIALEMGVTSE